MQTNNNLNSSAYSSVYFHTQLPQSILQEITRLNKRPHLAPTTVLTDDGFHGNCIVAMSSYWFAGMIWHYIVRVNQEIFNDIFVMMY